MRPQRIGPCRIRAATDQPLDGVHGRHHAQLVRLVEVLEQAAGLALRAMIERSEGLVPLGGQRDDDLPAVMLVAPADNQIAFFKAAQDAAEIAVVDIECRDQRGRGGFALLRQFVKHARL